MITKDSLNLSYDLSGDIRLTIPKSYIQNGDHDILVKSIERLIRSATKHIKISKDWNEDSAADVVGICKSDVSDGSVHHDRDIYGLE